MSVFRCGGGVPNAAPNRAFGAPKQHSLPKHLLPLLRRAPPKQLFGAEPAPKYVTARRIRAEQAIRRRNGTLERRKTACFSAETARMPRFSATKICLKPLVECRPSLSRPPPTSRRRSTKDLAVMAKACGV